MMKSGILYRSDLKHNVVLLVSMFLLGCLVSGTAAADGGPDCILCHDVTNTTTGHNVSVSAMNQSNNIHALLNINMNLTASSPSNGGNANNSICWGCHVSYGKKPSANYICSEANIYKCYECHNGTVAYENVSSAPVVKEHFKSGENIKAITTAANATDSCIVCHNQIEMKRTYTEPDTNYTNLSLASHYGKKRDKLVAINNTSAYCMYCHNTSIAFSSTNFSVTNDSMVNHATISSCTDDDCHAKGRIHDESLEKYKTEMCEGCHNTKTNKLHESLDVTCFHCHNNNTLNYSGTKLYPDSYNTKTTIHSNGSTPNSNISPLCTECHTKTADEIQKGYENASGGYAMMDDNINLAPYGSNMTHNKNTIVEKDDVTYARHANPNSDGGWDGARSVGERPPNQICINCHTSAIQDILKGKVGNQCVVCHGNEEYWSTTDLSHDFSLERNCSDCHHASYSQDHVGTRDLLSFLDPKDYRNVAGIYNKANNDAINGIPSPDDSGYSYIEWMMNNSVHRNMTWIGNELANQDGCLVCHTNVTFTMNGTASPVVINITDRSGIHTWNSNPDCTKCHSIDAGYRWIGDPKEHGDLGNNTRCFECHNGSLEIIGRPSDYEYQHGHDVKGGRANPDCISCHNVSGRSYYINISMLNSSESIHQNIRTYENINNPDQDISNTNKICWSCHVEDSSYPDSGLHEDILRKEPYTCAECHVYDDDGAPLPANLTSEQVPRVAKHLYGAELEAGKMTGDIVASCEICHNLSEMKLNVDVPPDATASYTVAHYGKKRTDLRVEDSANCSYCHNNISTNFTVAMVNESFSINVPEHSNYSSTPNCTDPNCHNTGWMHNASLTKPDLMVGGAEDSLVCLSCHGSGNYSTNTPATGLRQKHNNTLDCTECHLHIASDIHGVKYLQQDDTYNTSNSSSSAVDCYTCHSSGDVDSNISATIPKVPDDNYGFSHSDVSTNGTRWNDIDYWNNTNSTNEACEFCHNDTKHETLAIGPIINVTANERNVNITSDSNSYWCSGCHVNGSETYNTTLRPQAPPTININNTNNSTSWDGTGQVWYNHTLADFSDRSCKACHGSLLSPNPTTTEFVHNAAEGKFGPDCIGCHDIGEESPKVNCSIVNNSLSIHQNIMNYTEIPNGSSDVQNRICWACHMDDSNAPKGDNHADRLGDYNNLPVYTCVECHVNGSEANINSTILERAPDVYEHIYGGGNLTAGNSTDNLSSCEVCHNLSEMKLNVTLDNTLYGTDLDDQSNASYLIAHYGKKRGTGEDNIRTWDGGVNCSYCHQNRTSAFAVSSIMAKPILNSNIQNHSLRYPSSPANNCTNTSCHVGGRMHDASLKIPVGLTTNYSGGAPSSQVCLNCHGPGNYTTYTSTGLKQKHNNSLNCTECHLYEARDIHGVKYLQKDGTYSTSNTSAVDCYTCHSSGAVDDSINATVPKVPDNNYGFSHSDAPKNGGRWNEISYWDDSNGACEFCHNDTKHETIAIGPIINISADDSHVALTYSSTSQLCSGCHIDGKTRYNTTLRPQAPPTICVNNIGNNTSWDGTGQSWYNHSDIGNFYDVGCKGCHGSSLSTTTTPTTTEFVHNVAEGGGKYCVECHNTINMSMNVTFQIDVQAMNKSDAIHYDLNRAAIAGMNQSYSPDNVRCWACHGEGDGSDADQPEGHPERVRTQNPRNCSNMDCHNVNQSSFYEPMVYEHFKYVDTIDENISTKADCPVCHINSIMPNHDPNPVNSTNTSMVSHYGSTDDLINTTSCIYCHLDEDNAEEWGNAPDPTTNISRLSDEELEKTMLIGDRWHLGNRYFLEFGDIGVNGDSAYMQIYHNDILIDEIVVSDAYNYTYDDDFIDPDGDEVSDLVVLELNFTAVFRGEQIGLVMVEGRSWKRIHPEDKDPACWACHMDDYTVDKKKYLVLDADEDLIYYLEKLLDFSDEDTEDKVTLIPTTLVLREGYNQTLDVDGNYILTANEVDINGKQAHITLVKDGSVIEDSIYSEGETIEFEYDLSYEDHDIDDFVIFNATVDSIFHGYDTDLVSLTEVRVFSDRLMAADIDDDEKVGGYNTSQLHINDTFSIGGYPDTFHVPPLNEGLDGGSDCIRCHDVSHRFGISSVDAIQSRLGGHSQLNANATSKDNTIDDINKACWACHGTGVDPERHPADYLYPRQCQDCHTDMEAPTYGAVDLSDEAHGQVEDCSRCHAADYPGLHVINVFEPDIPYIIKTSVSSEVVGPGDLVIVDVTAMAGWNMKIKAVEYFIDVEGSPGTGTQLMPVDGTFDEQVKEVKFTIDTTGLEPGDHTIYIHAMERNNKWGPVNEVVFTIETEIPAMFEPEAEPSNMATALIIIGAGAVGLMLLFWKKGFLYLFSWDNVPGTDSEKLQSLLMDKFRVDWAENADISKSDDGKTILISKDENSAEIVMDVMKENVTLKLSDGRTRGLKVKMENGKRNIYGFFMPLIGKR